MVLNYDKRNHSMWHAIPMQDEIHANMFCPYDWVYVLDGQRHGRLPAVIMPVTVNIWGGEDIIREAGYRKHWSVWQNTITNEYTFGNKPAFASSPCPDDREQARNMISIDINLLIQL